MKRKHTKSYDELITGYYGNLNRNKKKKDSIPVVLSKSFDDGETLVQQSKTKLFEEYVVQSSITDIEFEEYVVEKNDLSKQSSVQSSVEIIPTEEVSAFQEYQTDIISPLANIEQSNDPRINKVSQSYAGLTNNDNIVAKSKSESADDKNMSKANEDDFVADMQAILMGQKVFDPASKKAIEKDKHCNQQSGSSLDSNSSGNTEFKNEHAIFDKIAQSMQYANAYDLGSVELDKRFSDFDKIFEIEKKSLQEKKRVKKHDVSFNNIKADSEDFIKDLDEIKKKNQSETGVSLEDLVEGEAESNVVFSAEFPSTPINLKPYTSQERKQVFGDFQYEADPSTYDGDEIKILNNWDQNNIVSVNIPQLNGKKINNQIITKGVIQFHRLGESKLRNLWLEWETAGLLDKILTYHGGFAPRFIRGTQSQNPRPLSNHAWGTAFDINAAWNAFGQEPALVGQTGSVRELVSIANRHGFFWGGHFKNKDGMHFELGKESI